MEFYAQPHQKKFGDILVKSISDSRWNEIRIAVAWVRESGVRYIAPSIESFLGRTTTSLRVVTGIDFQHTTYEGLSRLLEFERAGNARIYVHHNEASPIFHAKMYLLHNGDHGELIVGSNNLTAAGLFQNDEAGIRLEGALSVPAFAQALEAHRSWSDVNQPLCLELSADLLEELAKRNLISSERKSQGGRSEKESSNQKGQAKGLFSEVPVGVPPVPESELKDTDTHTGMGVEDAADPVSSINEPGASEQSGGILFMRLRISRGTQTQVPIRLISQPFFNNITHVTSARSQLERNIVPAGGKKKKKKKKRHPNTIKLDLPETKNFTDTVARFERIDGKVYYTAYDINSPAGKLIWAELQAGLETGETHMTRPSDPDTSTYWRFV